jgi:glycosyltransferase involved in cell wall biosynthesis
VSTSPRTLVCTICSANYLAQARVLMASLARTQPDWERHVLIVDEIGDRFDPAVEDFAVVEIADLPIPEKRKFFFRYGILELNTAVKPTYLRWLFEVGGYDRVIYLDPDICVYRPLQEVEEAFEAGALACLTPHLTGPLRDDKRPSEIDILKAGTHNLGFVGLQQHPRLGDFLEWWIEKTETQCVVDFDANLFLDQRWLDLAPGMFPDVKLIRHEGYNVAYWNLAHRSVRHEADAYSVNEVPLVFFHFSGLDPLAPKPLSKHQNRFTLADVGVVRELADDYCAEVLGSGYEACREWAYAFSEFADGHPLPEEIRSIYRDDASVERDGRDDPFQLGLGYFNRPWRAASEGQPLVTHLMRQIWSRRTDLQQHFPHPGGRNRVDFASWFVQQGPVEHHLPDCYVSPVRESLAVSAPGQARRARARGLLHRLAARLHPISRRLSPELKAEIKGVLRLATPPPPPIAVGALRTSVATWFTGFYPMDAHDRAVGGAWMGRKARVRLRETSGGVLTLEGAHHSHYFEREGSSSLALAFSLDGSSLGRVELERGGDFSHELRLTAITEESTLLIEADRVFVPAHSDTSSPDQRELSFRVNRLLLDDRPLVDFSARPEGGDEDPSPQHLPGVNIVGYVRSELGVGESSRLCATALEAVGSPFTLVDFSEASSNRATDDRWHERTSLVNPHPINIIHVNADQLPVAYEQFGPDFFASKYNIGVWHWELPEFPDEWLASFDFLHEVWVPSRFVMEAVSEKSPIPVVRMPHAISVQLAEKPARARFGLPDDRFLFLCMYDMHSLQERKNPEGAVEAFRRAFPDPAASNVGLVIKLMNPDTYREDFERLREGLDQTPGTFLIERTLSREDAYGLEAVCDAFVSLHRSEGFGLGLAESMVLGKPAIATHWSGNADFMDHANSCCVDYKLVQLEQSHGPYTRGQRWADPDLEQAADYMRRLVADPAYRRRIASAGQKTILSEHSPERVGGRIQRRLNAIARRL